MEDDTGWRAAKSSKESPLRSATTRAPLGEVEYTT
jgi:hypothetical protein